MIPSRLPGAALALALAAVLAATSPPARSEDGDRGVPSAIAALVGTSREEALAAEGLLRLEAQDGTLDAQALLVVAGDAGLRRAAERLSSERPLPAWGLEALVHVLSASRRPEVDSLLARASSDGRFEVRALVARALGAGRTPEAVDVLRRLATDATPSVRGAAVRALFAIDSDAARAARIALAVDVDPRIEEVRTRLHRQRGDGGPALLPVALRAYARGATPGIRSEGARCLAMRDVGTPVPVLAVMLWEHGTGPDGAFVVRAALGAPSDPTHPGTARLVAAEAIAALLARPDVAAETRTALLDLGVLHLARPASVRGMRVDDEARRVLVATLPEAGPALVPVLSARLARGEFSDPTQGMRLLSSLEESGWLGAVRALADPAGVVGRPAPSRPPPRRPVAPAVVDAVVRAAAGVLRDHGRTGDATLSDALLSPSVPEDVRRDAIHALAKDEAAVALPRLRAALADSRPAIASTAADVLLARPEPEARAALEEALLAPPWRKFFGRVFLDLALPGDEPAYALLDRAFASRSEDARQAAFDTFWNVRGPRGPRAKEVLLRERHRPPNGDRGSVARALAAVDGPSAVAYVRENLPTTRHPGMLLRNLQGVSDPGALDLALEVAARTGDPAMLSEVARVVAGPAGKDTARTDPFWRRMLATNDPEKRNEALLHLTTARHGDLTGVIRPMLSADPRLGSDGGVDAATSGDATGSSGSPWSGPDAVETERTRRLRAMRVLTRPWDPAIEPTLWSIASDLHDDEDVRMLAARRLAGHASEATRKAAAAWLRSPPNEDLAALATTMGDLAGRGATSAEAAGLLDALDAAITARYETPPYVRPEGPTEAAYGMRVEGMAAAVALAKDPVALDRLADLLFDPRFAAYAREARGLGALRSVSGGGALASVGVSPKSWERLRDSGPGSDVAQVPVEVRHVVAALKAASPEETGARVARAVASAQASGRLAAFDDVYLYRIAADLHHKKHGDFAAAAAAVEDAFARTLPATGPASLRLSDRVEWALRARRFEESAAAQREQVRAAASLGSPDADESWVEHRARLDFLLGAAAAAAGRPDEARDAFRRGLARAPNDPSALNTAAWVRGRAGFDLEAAEADTRRALALERRLDDEPSIDSLDTLAYVLIRQGRFAEARDTIRPAVERIGSRGHPGGGEILWHAAQASAGAGHVGEARLFVYQALAHHEPTLESWMRADPLLEKLHPRFDELVRDARAEREARD